MHHHNMWSPLTPRGGPQKAFSGLWKGVLCTIMNPNFGEFHFYDVR
jgi:hypothetical protein